MSQSLDDIFKKTGVIPDAVFSAHAHSYQRYTRRIGGKQVPYIVIGTGGMAPQNVTAATGEPADASNQTTYDNALAALGYLYVTISANQLKTEFWPLGNQHASGFDPLTIDLRNNMVTTPS